MAEIKWTDAQEAAITAAGDNILVSAAAGSGKTTVLVERVIRMLTRKENPVEIDRLLIMTFTKAAASSMKEKIFQAIRAKLEENPSDEHLKMQLAKVPMANISTIDSFCAEVVRENFQVVEIDPGFRMADESEVRLLKQDVLKELLENHYRELEEEFLAFVQSYIDKNDAKLEDLILTLFDFAESHPEPKAWLKQSVADYQDAGKLFADRELSEIPWLKTFMEAVFRDFEEVRVMAETGLSIAAMDHGPFAYEEPFLEIQRFMESLQEHPFDNRRYLIDSFLADWKKSPSVSKKDDVDEDLKKQAQKLRNDIKKKLEKIRDTWLYQTLEEMYLDMAACAPVAQTLHDLTVEFADAFQQTKKEKKIADFSDIAHFALEVLVEYDEDGNIRTDGQGDPMYTAVADQMALSFDEIIVDEYQDTNLLQECLIGALSQERFGNPNVFMVGDVKQSIYGFRMACPQLFIEKYDGYRTGMKNGRLIILDQNFRSRKEVIGVTNQVFEKAMIRDIGGIGYVEGHALVQGRKPEEPLEKADRETEDFPEEAGRKTADFRTELHMIEGGGEQGRRSEAFTVAERIEQLVQNEGFDYKDIVILSRTTNNPVLEKTLSDRGIPVIKSAKKGFFDSFEIRLVLDLLSVIDNPYQDIPLAAVLMSPLCNVSAGELALIKTGLPAGPGNLYDALLLYAPLAWFVSKLQNWQKRQTYMEITDFLEYVLHDSGLYDLLLAMPNGQNRKANLDFLKDKARSFSNGPYSGLFHFIRFIKEIKNVNVDFGQAQVASKDANAVQMMTIHGSKGLEFPVVFLVNAGKGQNNADVNGSIILDRDLGVGLELRNAETRLIKKTLLMETIKQKKLVDQYAEELRLLYVAMTRAQDKLIITGTDKSLSKHRTAWAVTRPQPDRRLAGFQILGAKTFLQLLGMILPEEGSRICSISFQEPEEVLVERADLLLENEAEKAKIFARISDDADTSHLEDELNYIYPFQKAAQIQAKIAPSQLEAEPARWLFDKEDDWQGVKPSASKGADRGNAYHRFLELFDLQGTGSIEAQRETLCEAGKLSTDYAALIDPAKIQHFLQSDLGKRMQKADAENLLHREQPFLLGTETDINHTATLTGITPTSDLPDPEILLVQGVIDAWFEEEGKIVLVDYKTDRYVTDAILIERYLPQQEAYAQALEQLCGKPVAEKYLYSFFLDREVKL